MRNLELHTIESATDIDSALLAGLLELDDIDGAECSACFDEVGYVNGGDFVSYAIVLDDTSQWNVCSPCASAVLSEEEID